MLADLLESFGSFLLAYVNEIGAFEEVRFFGDGAVVVLLKAGADVPVTLGGC